jgi:NADH-quinone oxidoreductase subunit E
MIPETLYKELSEHCSHYPSRQVGLIYVLQKLQEYYGGWLPDEAVTEAANIVGIPEPEVEGVTTFYNWFFREPVGKTIIACCDSISCYLCGAENLISHLEKRLGIRPGETTPDGRYTLLPVVCLGNCDRAPSVMIGETLYERVTVESLDKILDQLDAESNKEATR